MLLSKKQSKKQDSTEYGVLFALRIMNDADPRALFLGLRQCAKCDTTPRTRCAMKVSRAIHCIVAPWEVPMYIHTYVHLKHLVCAVLGRSCLHGLSRETGIPREGVVRTYVLTTY